jgi:hypothetical protein
VKRRACRSATKLRGSSDAKRLAVGILEGLAGLRGPQEASEALGISMNRYYQLEERALQGLVSALEPRPRGRRRGPEVMVVALEREKARLERELKRAQALVRSAQRTVGLPPLRREDKAKVEPDGKKKRRMRRAMVRATKVVEALRPEPECEASSTELEAPATESSVAS